MGDPLAGIDAIDWASLEDAYGPSVDTPARLRALLEGGETAARALGDLEAAVYHQGSYYPAAAPAARFLVALATAPDVPDRAAILSLLAAMSAGHDRDVAVGWDPHAFRSTPAAPDYPEARATIDAIVGAAPQYLALLDEDDAQVRAYGAYLIGGVPFYADRGASAREALAARLAAETSEEAAASMLLAYAVHTPDGPLPDTTAAAPLVDGARAVADAWMGRADADALEAAAMLPPDGHGSFPWAEGSLAAMAVTELGRLPDTAAALRRVLDAHLGRGGPLASPRIDDWSDAPMWPSPEQRRRDELVRTAMMFLARQVFAGFGRERAEDPITVEELDDVQRDVLRYTVEHGLAVPAPGIRWIDADSMSRFLRGGGALDRELEGAPLWKQLHRLSDGSTSEEETTALLEALAALPPEELFAVCADIAAGAYPHRKGSGGCVTRPRWQELLARLEPHWDALAEPLAAYRSQLVHAEAPPRYLEAQLALASFYATGEVPPVELDRLLLVGLPSDAAAARAIVEALPKTRRSVLVGRMLAPRRVTYYDLCDHDIVARETVAAFCQPGWTPTRFTTEEWLTKLGTAAVAPLRAALEQTLPAKKRALIERVLPALAGELVALYLDVYPEGDGLHATLVRESDEAVLLELDWPAVPEPEHIAALAEAIAEPPLTTVDIVDEAIDNTLAYRLQRLIADLGVRCVSTGGSTLTTSN